MENCGDYESIEVPDSYTGPRLSFPLLPDHATALVEAFRQKQVSPHQDPASPAIPRKGQQQSGHNAKGMALDLGCLCQGSTRDLFLARTLWVISWFLYIENPSS